MMENLFSLIFVVALLAGTALELWLLGRQMTHVRRQRDRVPAAFASRFSLAEHQKAADYTRDRATIGLLDVVVGAVILLGWTLGGGVEWLAASVGALPGSPLWHGVVAIVALLMINAVLDLPLSLWRTFRVEARYGFNRTSVSRFALDLGLQVLLTLVLGGPLVAAILGLMEAAGQRWWLYAWILWLGFSLLVTWAYPLWIAPLFNRFTPLDRPDLRQRIEHLLSRSGFRSNGIFVMDGSRRSSHGNAYFTGLARHKRIVFFDTLLEALSAEEIEAVLAHELGHYKRRHVLKRLVMVSAISLGGFALLGWLSTETWFYQGLGVSTPSPATALILFALAAPVFTLFASPIGAALMRRQEFEADDFAVQQTGAGHLVNALVQLYRDNSSTLTPDPLYSAFHDSHPPAAVRIARISSNMCPT
jgi:STE24 endopeptidase